MRLNGRLGDEELQHISKNGLFLSLFVLPKTRFVPLSTLACLWNVNVLDAEKAATTFAGLGILELKRGGVGLRRGEVTIGVSMHKAVQDACTWEAEKRGAKFMKEAHGRLVGNYYKQLAVAPDGEPERQWWAALLDVEDGGDDGYLTDNLIRHLSASGRIKETLSVLTDYQWTETRVQRSRHGQSLYGFIEDLGWFLRSLPNFTPADYCATGETIEEIREGLEFLAEASRRAAPIVAQNSDELSFQLYGRLAHRRERSRVVKRFLLSVDRRAEATGERTCGCLIRRKT